MWSVETRWLRALTISSILLAQQTERTYAHAYLFILTTNFPMLIYLKQTKKQFEATHKRLVLICCCGVCGRDWMEVLSNFLLFSSISYLHVHTLSIIEERIMNSSVRKNMPMRFYVWNFLFFVTRTNSAVLATLCTNFPLRLLYSLSISFYYWCYFVFLVQSKYFVHQRLRYWDREKREFKVVAHL